VLESEGKSCSADYSLNCLLAHGGPKNGPLLYAL